MEPNSAPLCCFPRKTENGLASCPLSHMQVKILLDLGADYSVTSVSGLSPIDLATKRKIVPIMSLFNEVLKVLTLHYV